MADAAKGLSLAAALLLAGCATGRDTGERWWPQATDPNGRPAAAAAWGRPETESEAGLFCNGRSVTVWLASEAPLSRGRPVPFATGAVTQALPERFAADGLGLAQFDIPLNAPLAAAIAGGARELRYRLPEGQGRLPLGALPSRVVRDCGG